MHESGCDQDACTEVPREEEELVGDWKSRKALGDDGEGASCACSVCGPVASCAWTEYIPAVLTVSISTSAKTWRGVL